MNRRTAFGAIVASVLSLLSGCKSMSSQSDDESVSAKSDSGLFSKMRSSESDTEAMGLSSRSREIEKNLGVK